MILPAPAPTTLRVNATLQTETFEHWLNASLGRVLCAWSREGRSLAELCFDWVDGPESEPKVIAVQKDPRRETLTLTVSVRSWVWKLPRGIAEGPAKQALSELLWPAQEQAILLEHQSRLESRLESDPQLPRWLKDWPADAQLRIRRAWPKLSSRRGTESGLRQLLSLLLDREFELRPQSTRQASARLGEASRLGRSARLASSLDLWVCRLRGPDREVERSALRLRLQAFFDSERPLTVQIRLEFVAQNQSLEKS